MLIQPTVFGGTGPDAAAGVESGERRRDGRTLERAAGRCRRRVLFEAARSLARSSLYLTQKLAKREPM